MIQLSQYLVLVLIGMACAVPSYLVPMEHRELPKIGSLVQPYLPRTVYEYQIVPSDQYIIKETISNDSSSSITDLSALNFWDCIPSLSTALTILGNSAVTIFNWIIIQLPAIFIGVAIIIGICGFTPYCTLTIMKPAFIKDCQDYLSVPYLNHIERFARDAFQKFEKLNEVTK